MNVPNPKALVALLDAAARGDITAHHEALSVVYDELRMVVARAVKREKPGTQIPAAQLCRESMARLLGDQILSTVTEAQFMAVASRAVRDLIAERALAASRQRKGPAAGDEDGSVDVLALNRAIELLSQVDPRQARVVELRYFGEMSAEACALALGVAEKTIDRDWAIGRAWLYRKLAGRP